MFIVNHHHLLKGTSCWELILPVEGRQIVGSLNLPPLMKPGSYMQEVYFLWHCVGCSDMVWCFVFARSCESIAPQNEAAAVEWSPCLVWVKGVAGLWSEGFHAFPLGHLETEPETKRSFSSTVCVEQHLPPGDSWLGLLLPPRLFILVKIKIYMPPVYWLRGIS